MKTARGVGNLELRELEEPKPKRDEVLIEVAAAGLCGTDIHIKHDQAFYTPPVVLGHEYSGTVVEVGSDVTSVKAGDHVVSPATAYCGKCQITVTANAPKAHIHAKAGWKIILITENGLAPVDSVW